MFESALHRIMQDRDSQMRGHILLSYFCLGCLLVMLRFFIVLLAWVCCFSFGLLFYTVPTCQCTCLESLLVSCTAKWVTKFKVWAHILVSQPIVYFYLLLITLCWLVSERLQSKHWVSVYYFIAEFIDNLKPIAIHWQSETDCRSSLWNLHTVFFLRNMFKYSFLFAVLFCLFYAYVFSLILLQLYLPQLPRNEPWHVIMNDTGHKLFNFFTLLSIIHCRLGVNFHHPHLKPFMITPTRTSSVSLHVISTWSVPSSCSISPSSLISIFLQFSSHRAHN